MTLAADGGKGKKPVVRLSTFRNAAKHLQKAGDFRPDMLEDQPIRTLIDEITDALMEGVNIGLKDAEIPAEMADKLGRDVFVFSGCKTYHELREASQLLRDDRGRVKPFGKFFEEVRQIHPEYNERYLEAEHQFAVHSAQSAAQWAEIEREGNDYDLQYRTANDGKVRPAHAKLEGLTRPQDDPCWSEIMPPNGWKCRCRVVQVRKGKYDYTDWNEVPQLVREATTDLDSHGRNRAEMFRFNPGMDKVIFPKHHPYYNLSIKAKEAVERLADNRFVSAKTKDQVLERLKKAGIRNADISEASIEQANVLLEAIEDVGKNGRLKLNELILGYNVGAGSTKIKQRIGGHYNDGRKQIYINLECFKNSIYKKPIPFKEGIAIRENKIEQAQKSIEQYREKLGKNTRLDKELKAYIKKEQSNISDWTYQIERINDKIKRGEQPIPDVVTCLFEDVKSQVQCAVYHELGHYIDHNSNTPEYFKQNKPISVYGETTRAEYFAEWFASYKMNGKDGVPDELLTIFEKWD